MLAFLSFCSASTETTHGSSGTMVHWYSFFKYGLGAKDSALSVAAVSVRPEEAHMRSTLRCPFSSMAKPKPLYEMLRVQDLCESRGGRPGLSVLMSLTVSVDVKQH